MNREFKITARAFAVFGGICAVAAEADCAQYRLIVAEGRDSTEGEHTRALIKATADPSFRHKRELIANEMIGNRDRRTGEHRVIDITQHKGRLEQDSGHALDIRIGVGKRIDRRQIIDTIDRDRDHLTGAIFRRCHEAIGQTLSIIELINVSEGVVEGISPLSIG